MKTFQVTVTETLQITVPIEAATRAEAEQISEHSWRDSAFILDADHFKDVTFKTETSQRERDDAR